MGTAQAVVERDLQYICRGLESEFATMVGKRLLIVGGAGFLGYYLVQSVLHWNDQRDGSRWIGLAEGRGRDDGCRERKHKTNGTNVHATLRWNGRPRKEPEDNR